MVDRISLIFSSLEKAYRPHATRERHRIWHTTGKIRCAKSEAVISNISSAVSSKRTVARITVIRRRGASQAEHKLVVTRTAAEEAEVAAVTVAVSVATVSVSEGSYLQHVVRLDLLEMHTTQ